jgi:hypothetical protein
MSRPARSILIKKLHLTGMLIFWNSTQFQHLDLIVLAYGSNNGKLESDFDSVAYAKASTSTTACVVTTSLPIKMPDTDEISF